MSDLASETADLLSVANASGPRSLNQLVVLATRQVRGCSAATAGMWRDSEPVLAVASHPDVAELIEAQIESGCGPVLDALAGSGPVGCPDTLTETRWPEYARAALRRGVRCSVTLASRRGAETVTLSLFGARPRLLDSAQLDVAELLITLGDTVVGNAADYGDARRVAVQLRTAAESRALVDQATGMLMQALDCTADEALEWLRRTSQKHNVKVADIARRVVNSSGTGGLDSLAV